MPVSLRLRAAALSAALALASLGGLRAEAAQALRDPDLGGRVSTTLEKDALSTRVGIDSGPVFLGLGLDASDSGSYLLGCLQAGEPRGPGACLLAGPGAPSGSLRVLADPASTSAFVAGPPVELDRSLGSRRAVASLREGPLTLFGIQEGEGPVAFAAKEPSEPRRRGATAGGLSLSAQLPGGRLEAAAAASRGSAASPASGWSPQPYATPAIDGCAASSPTAQALLLFERREPDSGVLFALSGSRGELAGGAGAMRLQARSELDSLGLGLRAGVASPGYRSLFGRAEEDLLGAAAELSLSLPRSASIGLRAELEAEGRGLRYSPGWGGARSLNLVLPLSAESYRFLEARAERRIRPDGESTGSVAFEARGGRPEEGGSAAAGVVLRWRRGFDSLGFSLSTDLAAPGLLPALGCEVSLELFDGARAASPVLARGGLRLSLPCGEAGKLRLGLDLPAGGLALEPRGGDASGDASSGRGAELGLRYSASLGPSARRPRSRKGAGPKACSIAHRAAS